MMGICQLTYEIQARQSPLTSKKDLCQSASGIGLLLLHLLEMLDV